MKFKKFLQESNASEKDIKIIVSLPKEVYETFESTICNESRHTKKYGKHPVHKDSPHFNGGEYHGHVDMPGGKQVTYTVSGDRLHKNKFPNQVPQSVKDSISQALGVNSDMLESYEAFDEIEQTPVFLLVYKQSKSAKLTALFERVCSEE